MSITILNFQKKSFTELSYFFLNQKAKSSKRHVNYYSNLQKIVWKTQK